jgi:hypothetical protein
MLGNCELQVWAYAPIFAVDGKIQDKNTVAPLSLSFILEESADDRIRLALKTLKEHFLGEGTRWLSQGALTATSASSCP